MKYIKQLLIILAFTLAGEVLARVIPLPIPAAIYGFVLLFVALCTGALKKEHIDETAKLLISCLGLLFVAIYAFTKKGRSHSYMVVVRCTPDSRAELTLSKLPAYRLKNKAFTATATEIVAEVRLSENDMKKLEALRSDPEVMEISIMSSVNGTAL